MSAAPTTEIESPKTFKEILDHVEGVAKEAGLEAEAERWTERKKELKAEWDKLSESEKAQKHSNALAAEFKAALAGVGGQAQPQGRPQNKGRAGDKIASLLPFIAKGGHQSDRDRQAGMQWAQDKGFDSVAKALEFATYESAGVLVPDEHANDFIEATYASNVVMELGASSVDISGGEVVIGKQNQSATAYWTGEGEQATESNQTFGEKKLTPHELSILVPITNKLLDRLPAGMESIIRDDMVNVGNNALDKAYIRGAGTAHTPQGILHQTAGGNKFDATDGPTVAQIAEELLKCQYLVEVSDAGMQRPGWMFHPRVKYFLMQQRTSDGFPIYQQELSNGTLHGHAVGTTTQIPITKDTDGDETEIYFGDFAQVVIGTDAGVRVSEGPHAYQDSDGNTVFSFQSGITVMKLDTSTDICLRRDDAFGIIENADWGNSLG